VSAGGAEAADINLADHVISLEVVASRRFWLSHSRCPDRLMSVLGSQGE